MENSFVVQRIEQLCSEKGWTHYRLAKESGIPHSTLHNMLKRNTVLTVPSIIKFCDAFNITVAQFFADDKELYLSDEEIHLLKTYRRLDDTQKKIATAYVQGLLDCQTAN